MAKKQKKRGKPSDVVGTAVKSMRILTGEDQPPKKKPRKAAKTKK